MKHLFEYDYEQEEISEEIMNDDWCGFGTCSDDCTLSCSGTGWCLWNVGR